MLWSLVDCRTSPEPYGLWDTLLTLCTVWHVQGPLNYETCTGPCKLWSMNRALWTVRHVLGPVDCETCSGPCELRAMTGPVNCETYMSWDMWYRIKLIFNLNFVWEPRLLFIPSCCILYQSIDCIFHLQSFRQIGPHLSQAILQINTIKAMHPTVTGLCNRNKLRVHFDSRTNSAHCLFNAVVLNFFMPRTKYFLP